MLSGNWYDRFEISFVTLENWSPQGKECKRWNKILTSGALDAKMAAPKKLRKMIELLFENKPPNRKSAVKCYRKTGLTSELTFGVDGSIHILHRRDGMHEDITGHG